HHLLQRAAASVARQFICLVSLLTSSRTFVEMSIADLDEVLEAAATPDAAEGAGLPHPFAARGLPESRSNREFGLRVHLGVTEAVLRVSRFHGCNDAEKQL